MLRKTLWYGLGWIFLVLTVPLLWLAEFYERQGRLNQRDRLAERMTVKICRVLISLTGSTVQIEGLENVPTQGAVLFVSNHQGHLDSLVIHGYINKPKGFVSIVEILKIPFISHWMKCIQSAFIDRNDPRQATVAVSQAVETLKSGHSMVVFPEGKLSDGSQVGDFNKGWLRLATKSGVPIVPISIDGTYKAFAKDGKTIRPADIRCVVAPPVSTANLSKADEMDFVDNLKQIIVRNIRATEDRL